MKKRIINSIISVLIILISLNSFLIIADSDCNPDVTIPSDYSISFYVESGADSYFIFTINDPYNLFQDRTYRGWCVQSDKRMSHNVYHSGIVYSSYDPDMPDFFKQDPGIEKWKQVNFLLNHKEVIYGFVNEKLQCTVNKKDMQDVIWYLIGDITYDQIGNCSKAIVDYLSNETRQLDIDTYCPQLGDILVVLVDTYQKSDYSIQKVIIEFYLTDNDPYNPPNGDTTSHAVNRTNIPPTADGSKNEPYKTRFNQTILFDGSQSYDYDGMIVEWKWSFGDGTTELGKIVSHIYNKAGMYLVYLNVTDDEGAQGSYNTSVQIRENTPPSHPLIIGTLVCDDTTKVYDYLFSSTDLDNDTIRYKVDWGDGSEVVTSEYFDNNTKYMLSHFWNTSGIYTLQVYAEDAYHDFSDTTEVTVSVNVNRYYYAIENLRGYFIDYYKDGSIDAFHNDETGMMLGLQPEGNGWYLLDANEDGISEYKYNQTLGLQTNVLSDETSEPNWFMDYMLAIIILVVACIVVVFIIVFRWKRK